MITLLSTWTVALVVIFGVSLIYLYLSKVYSFWSSRGVSGPRPLPLLGNLINLLRKSQYEIRIEWFRQYGRVYGTYEGLEPILVVSDAELIKQVMIKDFPSFVNRRKEKLYHDVVSRNLFASEDDDWKRIRTIVTPSFTSGKLRGMQLLMNQCVEKLDNYFTKITTDGATKELNIRDVMSGFTIDVIASTAFATDTNSNDDRSKTNPFVVNGVDLFRISILKVLTVILLPKKILDWFGVHSFLPAGPQNFFIDLCKRIVLERKKRGAKHKDLVQMMLDAYVYESDLNDQNYDKLMVNNDVTETQVNEMKSAKEKKTLSEIEVVAQCFLFFVAGFETTATTLSYCLYELAKHPQVQEKLFEEITEIEGNLDRSSNEYLDRVMHHMPYLEGVIKETLRKYPPLSMLERRVGTEEYKLDGIPLHKDQIILISTLAVHNDPEYYPEPELYKPERWLPENKHQLVPYTYLPFGEGPRNCVGMRFAYQEIKLALAQIVTKYRFSASANTPNKLSFVPGSFLLIMRNVPINISRR